MGEVKWIKVQTNLFENRKIKLILNMPDGDKLLRMWLHLLCLAGSTNDNGYVYITKEIPFNSQSLATLCDLPTPVIELGLQMFERFKMIEVVDDFLMISNWEKYQNVEGMEKVRELNRIRNIAYRERKKEALLTDDVIVTSRDAIDKDKEEEKNKNNNKRFIKPTLEEVKAYCQERNNKVDAEKWLSYYESNGWNVGRNSMKDWKACIRTWEKNNYSNNTNKQKTTFRSDEMDVGEQDFEELRKKMFNR